MSAQENAEAILIVIKRLLKWIGIAIAVVVLFFCAALVYEKFDRWFSVERFKKDVAVTVKFDTSLCDKKQFPLFIGVFNNSSKTIESTSVYVKVTKKGYSQKLNEYSSFKDDKILKPKEGISNCWAVEGSSYKSFLDGVDMDAELDSYYVTFKK